MGARGPIPKRSDQLHGHRSREQRAAYDQVPVDEPPTPAGEADPKWHPIAKEWFTALGQSGQSRFYEPSDWATARYVAEAMSRNLAAGQRMSGQMFAAIMSSMSNLLVTEGDRRRVKLELTRTGGDAPDPSEDAADAWLRELTS